MVILDGRGGVPSRLQKLGKTPSLEEALDPRRSAFMSSLYLSRQNQASLCHVKLEIDFQLRCPATEKQKHPFLLVELNRGTFTPPQKKGAKRHHWPPEPGVTSVSWAPTD